MNRYNVVCEEIRAVIYEHFPKAIPDPNGKICENVPGFLLWLLGQIEAIDTRVASGDDALEEALRCFEKDLGIERLAADRQAARRMTMVRSPQSVVTQEGG